MRSDKGLSVTERARREQIMGATVELLAERGYAAASLSTIAARIGASKGVILYHFDGKEELIRHVAETVLADAAAFMTPRIGAVQTAAGKLRAYIDANLQFLGEHRDQIRALTAILGGLPPGQDNLPAYAAAGQAAVEALAELLRQGQASGEFKAFEPMIVARSLRASIDAVSQLLQIEPDVDLSAYAEGLHALFGPAALA